MATTIAARNPRSLDSYIKPHSAAHARDAKRIPTVAECQAEMLARQRAASAAPQQRSASVPRSVHLPERAASTPARLFHLTEFTPSTAESLQLLMAQAHHTVEAPTSVFFRLSQRPPPTAAAVVHVSSSVPASLSALDACSEQAEPVATDLDNVPAQPATDGSEQSVEFPASADAACRHELARRSSFASADQLHECFLAHAADGRMDEPSAVAVLATMFGSRAGGGRTGPVAARSSCGAADERLAAPAVSRREAMRSWLAERYFRLIDVGKVSKRRAAVRAACLTGASPSLHFDTVRLYF